MDKYILDQTDVAILNLLQLDAHLTNKELAHRLKKSPTPIYDRVRRLEDLKYIKRYVAIIDHSRVGEYMTAYLQVQIKEHSKDALVSFQEEINNFDEVMECYHTTGAFDFILKVVTPNMNKYNDFLLQKLGSLPNIGTLQSSVVISNGKHETAFPL